MNCTVAIDFLWHWYWLELLFTLLCYWKYKEVDGLKWRWSEADEFDYFNIFCWWIVWVRLIFTICFSYGISIYWSFLFTLLCKRKMMDLISCLILYVLWLLVWYCMYCNCMIMINYIVVSENIMYCFMYYCKNNYEFKTFTCLSI